MSHSVKKPKPFWFQCLINRNGVCTMRQGTVHAEYAYMALDNVKELADEWGMPLIETGIYEIDENGEVGKQILKSEGGSTKFVNYTSSKPEPKPYEFGTWFQKKTYKVLNIGDT